MDATRERSQDQRQCVICRAGEPRDVIAELGQVWVTAAESAALPGYVCLVSRTHVREPYQLTEPERAAFWRDVDDVARAIDAALRPAKLNYEVHGNTIPHLHLHLFPRTSGDPFDGRPIDGGTLTARPDGMLDALRSALVPLVTRAQRRRELAALKERGAAEIAEIDRRLANGEIDEDGWHEAMAELIGPPYLAAETPWAGSGYGGTAEDWESARSLVAHAIDRDGSFLDVGCANGYLLQCLPRWTTWRLERWGLDIVPAFVARARSRLPDIADRLIVGNALHWNPPRRFTYIRTGLEYVPRHRRREYVERLLAHCDRLIIGAFNEEADARPTEETLAGWGHRIAGRSERAHSRKPELDYRVLWIDHAGPPPA